MMETCETTQDAIAWTELFLGYGQESSTSTRWNEPYSMFEFRCSGPAPFWAKGPTNYRGFFLAGDISQGRTIWLQALSWYKSIVLWRPGDKNHDHPLHDQNFFVWIMVDKHSEPDNKFPWASDLQTYIKAELVLPCDTFPDAVPHRPHNTILCNYWPTAHGFLPAAAREHRPVTVYATRPSLGHRWYTRFVIGTPTTTRCWHPDGSTTDRGDGAHSKRVRHFA